MHVREPWSRSQTVDETVEKTWLIYGTGKSYVEDEMTDRERAVWLEVDDSDGGRMTDVLVVKIGDTGRFWVVDTGVEVTAER